MLVTAVVMFKKLVTLSYVTWEAFDSVYVGQQFANPLQMGNIPSIQLTATIQLMNWMGTK